MDLKHVNQKKPAQPSKLLALVALLVAISLPVFLVKTFRDKQHGLNTSKSLSFPKYESTLDDEQIDSTDDEVAAEENQSNSSFTETSESQEDSTEPEPKESALLQTLPTPEQQITKSTKPEDKWEVIITKNGDTLATLFKRLGINKQTLATILQDNPHAKALSNIKPGQKLQFAVHKDVLDKLIVPLTPTQSILISRQGSRYITQINSRKISSHNHYVTATVRGSLYGTAKRLGVSYKLIQQMVDIFNWEIDFSKDVRAGDRFTIVYKAFFIENKEVGTGEIIAVTYTTSRGKTYQAIRHTKRNGEIDYYNEKGLSLRKAFSRYPLTFSHISSTFSLSRMHPVLKKRRPHKGVDLAAPIGTPIRAVGDGVITSIGRQNGYGNMIKIKHNGAYHTVYAHMLKFQKGLSRGSRVKRGQVIGYVGQTGLATGPHCHFEFHINGNPKNPTTIDLPRGSPIASNELASFKSNAGALLAHMKLFEEAHLASEQTRSKTAKG
ncbi:peptidoglycan DD-metalloendopeptidase family protein [Legionella impletisoli]|uniref:Peptidase M24 n=1 Tax=Legionella impletisoli TaxID=343510 RepID=A0A917JZ65_9GAMM|nr:peptidoglycan DD-metalloendopeptidase family protein [Legionella impletisoli]GGI91800.1 peptidase M24 [Legionella impletisoli]